MNWTRLMRGAAIFCAVILIAPSAHANVMVPFFVVGAFGMFLALVPIIIVETAMLMRVGVHVWDSLLAMSAANLASTLVGIPVAAILEAAVVAEIPPDQNPWEDESTRFREWMVPVSGVALLVPFFLVSWWIEAPVAAWFLDQLPPQFVNYAVRDANIVTYSVLALLVGRLLCLAVADSDGMRAMDRHADRIFPAGTWQIANRRARRGMAGLRAKESKILRRFQAQPMHSPELYDSWRFANDRAREGIAWLRVAETVIDRRRQTSTADLVERAKVATRDQAA